MAESGEDQCEVTITGTEKARGRAAALVGNFFVHWLDCGCALVVKIFVH